MFCILPVAARSVPVHDRLKNQSGPVKTLYHDASLSHGVSFPLVCCEKVFVIVHISAWETSSL